MQHAGNPLAKCLAFIQELDQRRIYYRLSSVRDAIMVEVHVPGARWEVEFFADGHVETEVFRSSGAVLSGAEAEDAIQRLLDEDDEAEARETPRRSSPEHTE